MRARCGNRPEIDRLGGAKPADLARQRPDLAELIQRAEALRRQIAATAARLASIEDDIARVHDEIAAHRSSRSSEYRHAAEEARKRVLGARETEHKFSE